MKPRINENKTVASPDGKPVNPRWATYAFTWPNDPSDPNTPDRLPFRHLSDDFMEGETYTHLHRASGGVIPEGLRLNDYLRWEFTGDDQIFLEPNTQYAFLFLFDEPAAEGVNRNIPLSNRNVLFGGRLSDAFPDGHLIRREGSSVDFDAVFIRDKKDPADVDAARHAASFPVKADGTPDLEARLAIQPGTLGYPDVDTYRDLYFYIESAD